MKKFIVMMMTCLISFQASAGLDVIPGLRKAFEEYYYSMTVEWDQENISFKEAQEKTFTEALEELKRQGMKQEDIYSFFNSYPQAQGFGSELQGMLTHEMDSRHLLESYNQIAEKGFSSGTSWNGRLGVGGIVFISAGAIILTVLGLWAFGVVDCKNERYCFSNGYDCKSKVVCH